ncbi:hypothetical protein C1889_10145 [Pseudomonas sp. FW507-12TSA]|nr:hypothetical protein C1889_10145 [Pseudomonas sp. FW507-12TSA]
MPDLLCVPRSVPNPHGSCRAIPAAATRGEPEAAVELARLRQGPQGLQVDDLQTLGCGGQYKGGTLF